MKRALFEYLGPFTCDIVPRQKKLANHNNCLCHGRIASGFLICKSFLFCAKLQFALCCFLAQKLYSLTFLSCGCFRGVHQFCNHWQISSECNSILNSNHPRRLSCLLKLVELINEGKSKSSSSLPQNSKTWFASKVYWHNRNNSPANLRNTRTKDLERLRKQTF